MRIVIDITDEMWKAVQDGWVGNELWHSTLKNGTSLPKGHGRLIDAELLLNEIHDLSTEPMADLRMRLRNAPTVIEADKEVENDN